MAEDWAVDVKKYAPAADDTVIAAIVKHCGIALRTRDASLVAFSDKKETDRVRDGYCRKKLALTESDAVVDKAIADVGKVMKADRTKNRVTVYYLLAEKFGKLDLFSSAKTNTKAAPKNPVVAKKAVVPTAAAATAVKAAAPKAAAKTAEPVVAAAPVVPPTAPVVVAAVVPPAAAMTPMPSKAAPMAAYNPPTASAGGLGIGKVLGLLALLALAAFILWWLFGRTAEPVATGVATESVAVEPAPVDTATPAPAAEAAAPVVQTAAPVVEQAATAPASVTATEVDGKPVVSVFFATAKTDVARDFSTVAKPIKAWVDANPGAQFVVSGYNDPTGDPVFNAKLSKNRAKAVRAALVALGVPDASIEMLKPSDTTDKTDSLANGRRVDIKVKDAG